MLRRILTEKYIVLVEQDELGIDYVSNIIQNLKDYAMFEGVPFPKIEEIYSSKIKGIIPSINGFLEIVRLWNEHQKDLCVSLKFNYLEGTSPKDLSQVRKLIKKSGLEKSILPPEIKKKLEG